MSEDLARIDDNQAREVGLPSPAALDYMMSVANMLITSNLLGPDLEPSKDQIGNLVAAKWPQSDIDAYRDKVIKSNALAKMLIGREMHMSAMESLQDISIVKGKMFVHYSQLLSQIERKGYACTWVERTETRAALKVARNGFEMQFEFTIEDAKRAGLMDCAEDKKKYNQYYLRPRVMLTARVASEAYRTTGGRANIYTPEEKQEVLALSSGDSTMDEPTESDQKRADVLDAKYHVGLKTKTETPAAPAATVAADPAAPPVETTKAPVAQMPNPVAPAASQAQAGTTSAAPPHPKLYEIHSIRNDGKYEIMTSETPQTHKDMAALRARALCNQFKGSYLIVENDNGKLTEVDRIEPPKVKEPEATAESAADKPKPTLSPLKQRLNDITMTVEKCVNNGVAEAQKQPLKTVAARVKTFLQGYHGVDALKDLPTDPAEYVDSFADLESCARQDVNELFSAPAETGKSKAADNQKFAAYFAVLKWPVETVTLARGFARLRGLNCADFKTFVENLGLDFMGAMDVHAAMRLCLKTRSGGKFIRECASRKMSIAAALGFMEQRRFDAKLIETADDKAIESAIEWAMTSIREEAEKSASTPKVAQPPMPQPPAVEEDSGDLFDSLP